MPLEPDSQTESVTMPHTDGAQSILPSIPAGNARFAPAKPADRSDETDDAAIHSSPWILVAEDSPILQKIIVHHLTNLGYQFDVVPTGVGAVEAIKSGKYSAILMDWQMPEMDGLNATRVIRHSDEDWANIPIIAMTANAMEGDRAACLTAGMSDYVSKPFTKEQLKAVLDRWSPREKTM
jgi:CheY-like chemotaxis protein